MNDGILFGRFWWVMDYSNRLDTYTFGYCNDPQCEHSDEHDWDFDGSIFYPATHSPIKKEGV